MASKKKATLEAKVDAPSQATIRFYCQGIGDSHLLHFQKADGQDFWMLIDCGIHTSIKGGSQKIEEIVKDIASVTNRLDVVVGTHEHWDHLSGFLTAREIFEQITVGEVWLGWTEDPQDAQAHELDKFKRKALDALQKSQQRLSKAEGRHLAAVRHGVDALLGFQFGLKGEKVRASRDALVSLATKKVRYLAPSNCPLAIPGLPNLRVYVLGPPRNETFIKIRERQSEMYGLRSALARVDSLASAFDSREGAAPDASAPFEPNMGLDLQSLEDGSVELDDEAARHAMDLFYDRYLVHSERRIDFDWLSASSELAIQLDDRTNNSSLVLAFEFIDTGRVLLFTADAQVGNWLSWQDLVWTVDDRKVSGPELLARTVLLKVGHHGSQNATLENKGLELMRDPDLSAFIPTNREDAQKVGWGEMPYEGILDALEAHAGKRVFRADDPWVLHASGSRAPIKAPSGSIRAIRRSKVDGLWLELDVS